MQAFDGQIRIVEYIIQSVINVDLSAVATVSDRNHEVRTQPQLSVELGNLNELRYTEHNLIGRIHGDGEVYPGI